MTDDLGEPHCVRLSQIICPGFNLNWYYSNETQLEGRYGLIEGELVELPPESERNHFIARYL